MSISASSSRGERRRAARALCLFAVFLTLCSGCVQVPKEAPQLSAELGKRIQAIEASHIELLRKFMDEKRRDVDEFIDREWTPRFSANLMNEELVRKQWDAVAASGDPNDKVKFIQIIAPRLQQQINAKRLEMMQPLDELERAIERRLRDEYTQATAINNAVTSFLYSASEVAANRDRFLGIVGVTQDEVNRALDGADEAVASLVNARNVATESVADAAKRVEEFRTRMRAAIDGVRGATE
jgi:hypothetical protein